MLLILAILFVAAIAVLIGFFVRREVVKTLSEQKISDLPPANYRPLFEPGEAELREAEREEAARIDALREEENVKAQAKKLEKFEEFRQTWARSSDKTNTVELLYRASQTASGEAFWQACENVLSAWHTGDVADISAEDLAQVLESHFWLLPVSERTPGLSFRLNEELKRLRG